MSSVVDLPSVNVVTDIEPRVHGQRGVLWTTLEDYGQIDSIIVEGPDENGMYFVIDGLRSFEILKRLGYKSIKCRVIRGITSTAERNRLRLVLQSSSKPLSRAERTFLYEQAGADPQLLKGWSNAKQKALRRDQQIPKSIRRKVEEHRASQELLAVIWLDLGCQPDYRDELIERLCQREIGVAHAHALKRLVRSELYDELTEKQRRFAIEAIIQRAKVTDADADHILIQAIMTEQPTEDYAPYWIMYMQYQIESLKQQVHPEVGKITPEQVKWSILHSANDLVQTLNLIFATKWEKAVTQPPREVSSEPAKSPPRLTSAAKGLSQVEFVKSKTASVPYFKVFERGIKVVFPPS